MSVLPRLAIGTVQPGADHHVLCWALLQALANERFQVQSFYSQGHFVLRDPSRTITGLQRRYLDSWLMQPPVCRELFRHGMQGADIGLVDGTFDAGRGAARSGGSLDALCTILDLPVLAIVDADRLPAGCLPPVPPGTVGLLLDNVANIEQLCYLQTTLESLYGIPILGSLERVACLRALAGAAVCGAVPSGELCQALGQALRSRLQVERIMPLASRPFTTSPEMPFARHPQVGDLHIAVAFDEAFTCYFPDTLDVLELLGASVSVFSPLRSEGLPSDTDVVYLGCGQPEYFVAALAENVCIREAIWNHVHSGHNVYAESAGMAYLAQEIQMPCGRRWPMVGVLPSIAQLAPTCPPPRPTEWTVRSESWLYRPGQRVRGYLNSRWQLSSPTGPPGPATGGHTAGVLMGNQHVVASQLHVHFASQPELLQQFVAQGRQSRVVATL